MQVTKIQAVSNGWQFLGININGHYLYRFASILTNNNYLLQCNIPLNNIVR